jgi:hypothetical protein
LAKELGQPIIGRLLLQRTGELYDLAKYFDNIIEKSSVSLNRAL